MNVVKQEFDRRVGEIDIYLRFLRDVEKDGSEITVPVRIGAKKRRSLGIDNDIKTILKANVFLLLYNLIEATAERSLVYVFDSLQSSGLTYRDVTAEVQAAWRKDKLQGMDGANFDTLSIKVHDLLVGAIDRVAVELSIEGARRYFQGNIDAEKLRGIAKRFGFALKSRKISKGGADLETVRRKRNDLAHGNFSFCEAGRDSSFEELEAIKRKVVHYLSDFMKSVDRFVMAEEFKVA